MVHLEENSRNQVFSSPGVVRYLFYLGKPAVVSPQEIELMQNHLNGVYKDILLKKPVLGSNYNISQGPFSGLSGKVVQSSKSRVKLELHSLGMIITLTKQAAWFSLIKLKWFIKICPYGTDMAEPFKKYNK